MKLASSLPCLDGIDCRDIAECDSSGMSRDVILINPRARSALAEANPEATDIVIEVDCLRPSPGKVELGDIFEQEFHGSAGRLGKVRGRFSAWSRVAKAGQQSAGLSYFTGVYKGGVAFPGQRWPSGRFFLIRRSQVRILPGTPQRLSHFVKPRTPRASTPRRRCEPIQARCIRGNRPMPPARDSLSA